MDELSSLANVMSDRFFKARDKELLAKLKAVVAGDELRAELTAVSGIEDASVLDSLAQVGIEANTIAAISLIPLVTVAWADREMEAAERDAILKSAVDAGITAGTPSYGLLDSWLDHKPDDQLFDSWVLYVKSMKTKLDAAAFGQLKSGIVSQSLAVAESAGGYLGLGNKVSQTEKDAIAEIEKAFA